MSEQNAKNNNSKQGNFKRKILGIVLIVLALGVVGSVIGYLRYRKTHVYTDDAFIDGGVTYVSSRIPGKVSEVLVSSNQPVEKDQVLVKIDTVDIEAELAKAKANLEMAENQVAGQYVSIKVINAQLRQLYAQRTLLSKERERFSSLLERGAVAANDYDKVIANWRAVNAQIQAARKKRKQIKTSIGDKGPDGKEAAIRLAEAQIAAISLQLEHAVIKAPAKGYITRKNVEVGEVVAAGQPLMAVVDLDDIYITANYKETDITRVRPGLKVIFKVDTYPGVKFEGRVDSIMAGTGAVFSMLPPENATGNYVKVVQRIPIKIKFTNVDTDKYPMRLGMSVVPVILIENK